MDEDAVRARFEEDLEELCDSFKVLPNDDERLILYDMYLAGCIAGMDTGIDIAKKARRGK